MPAIPTSIDITLEVRRTDGGVLMELCDEIAARMPESSCVMDEVDDCVRVTLHIDEQLDLEATG